MKHTCHAKGCTVAVPPKMFMCRPHWYKVPKPMRDKLWDLFVPGQEVRKDPTPEYIEHAVACIKYVADLEAA